MYIYFLTKNEKVVYVGKTKNIKRRISQHKDKDFDNSFYKRCDDYMANQLEDYYIMMYDPIYNKSLNSKGEYKSLQEFCQDNGFGIDEIRKVCAEIPYINPYFNENYNPYELNALKEIYSSWEERQNEQLINR